MTPEQQRCQRLSEHYWSLVVGLDDALFACQAAWVAAWPQYCRICEGAGAREDEPCACTDDGTCPRCGAAGLTSEERGHESTGDGPCALCGWNYEVIDGCFPSHPWSEC